MSNKWIKVLVSIGLTIFVVGLNILLMFLVDKASPMEDPRFLILHFGMLAVGLELIYCIFLQKEEMFESFLGGLIHLLPLIICLIVAGMNFFPDVMMGTVVGEYPYITHILYAIAPSAGLLFVYCYYFATGSLGEEHPWIFKVFVPTGLVVLSFGLFGLLQLAGDPLNKILSICVGFAGLLASFGGWLIVNMFSGGGSSSKKTGGVSSQKNTGKKFTNNEVWHMAYGHIGGGNNVTAKIASVNVEGFNSSQMYNTYFFINVVIEVSANSNASSGEIQRAADSAFKKAEAKLKSNGVGYEMRSKVEVKRR